MPEDPSSGDPSSFLKSGLTAVTLLSTLMTIALGIGTYLLNVRVGQAEQALKARAQKLQEASADVARYDFVFKTLSNIDKGSSVQRTLAVNTARLVLKAGEQETLFKGLSYSKDEALADVGRQGVALSRALTQARPTFGKEKKQEPTEPSPAPEEQSSPPIVPQPTEAPRPIVEPPPPPPEPTLSAATVAFHTTTDDKDEDAAVSVTISSGSSVLFTWQEAPGEEWKRHSDKNITLQRVAEAPRSLLENAKITICLDRKKKHGWKFDYTGKLWIGSEALSFGHKGNEIEHGAGRSCLPPLGIG